MIDLLSRVRHSRHTWWAWMNVSSYMPECFACIGFGALRHNHHTIDYIQFSYLSVPPAFSLLDHCVSAAATITAQSCCDAWDDFAPIYETYFCLGCTLPLVSPLPTHWVHLIKGFKTLFKRLIRGLLPKFLHVLEHPRKWFVKIIFEGDYQLF